MDVCLSRLSLKFLRDGSVNVGHLSNTAADFCSPVRLLHSSVGVGFPRSPDKADYSRNEMRLVQPRLVENRVYAYRAYPQTVEDELDRKDARLVPSCQCLSTVKRPPALLACVYSRALATLHAVRKETTMKTIQQSGAPPTRRHRKEVKMSKQTLREGPMGKETTGERIQTLSGNLSGKWSASLLSTLIV